MQIVKWALLSYKFCIVSPSHLLARSWRGAASRTAREVAQAGVLSEEVAGVPGLEEVRQALVGGAGTVGEAEGRAEVSDAAAGVGEWTRERRCGAQIAGCRRPRLARSHATREGGPTRWSWTSGFRTLGTTLVPRWSWTSGFRNFWETLAPRWSSRVDPLRLPGPHRSSGVESGGSGGISFAWGSAVKAWPMDLTFPGSLGTAEDLLGEVLGGTSGARGTGQIVGHQHE